MIPTKLYFFLCILCVAVITDCRTDQAPTDAAGERVTNSDKKSQTYPGSPEPDVAEQPPPDEPAGEEESSPKTVTTAADKELMPSFPFPPPKASASHTFAHDLFAGASSLYAVNERINAALRKGGYYEKSYYRIPEGFALVTRLEKFEKDGSPCPEEERWKTDNAGNMTTFSLYNYFKSLFTAEDGNYRIIVFMVTARNLTQKNETMTIQQAKDYLALGANRLPNSYKDIPYTNRHACTALIYEWYKPERDEPVFRQPSEYTGRYHLMKNRFTEYVNAE